MIRALTLLSMAVLAAGIYPEGHFDHSVKLTQANFEDTVKETVCMSL